MFWFQKSSCFSKRTFLCYCPLLDHIFSLLFYKVCYWDYFSRYMFLLFLFEGFRWITS
jgi:hypothetical protein